MSFNVMGEFNTEAYEKLSKKKVTTKNEYKSPD
jgi:hypothetical protein